MAVMNAVQQTKTVLIHKSTTNQSFLDMHYYLKEKGIQNNDFFLILIDSGLAGIDPRDPKRLNSIIATADSSQAKKQSLRSSPLKITKPMPMTTKKLKSMITTTPKSTITTNFSQTTTKEPNNRIKPTANN